MTQETLLLVDTDRLGPTYQDGKQYLAATWSVSLANGADLGRHEKLLKPWEWKGVNVRVFGRKKGQWSALAPKKNVNSIDPKRPENLNKLESELSHRFDAVKAVVDALIFDPTRRIEEYADKHVSDSSQKLVAGSGMRWPHLLEEVRRLPAPIGLCLNLAEFVAVYEDHVADCDAVAIVPDAIVYSITGPQGGETTYTWSAADSVPTPVEGSPGLCQAELTLAPPERGVSLRAVVSFWHKEQHQAAKRAQTGDDAYLSLDDLWVRFSSRRTWGGRSWVGELPYEAADAADLAQHLLDAWADVVEGKDPQGKDLGPKLEHVSQKDATKMFNRMWSALRFAAHSGVAASDGGSGPHQGPLQRVAEEVFGSSGKEIGQVRRYEYDWDITSDSANLSERLAEWKFLLKNTLLKEALGQGAVPDDPPGPMGATELLTQLRRLYAAARAYDPKTKLDVQQSILRAHWSKAKIEHADSIPLGVGGPMLRQRLILDKLDSVWTRMIEDGGDGADEIARMRDVFAKTLYEEEAMGRLGLPKWDSAWDAQPAKNGKAEERLAYRLYQRIKVAAAAMGPEGQPPDGGTGDSLIGPDTETRGAHPLSLVVGRVRPQRTSDQLGQDASAFSRLSGIGVLLRQRAQDGPGFGPWRCLTLAAVKFQCEDQTPVLPWGLAPLRIVQQGGLDNWTVTYDDHPLSAHSLFETPTSLLGLDEKPEPELRNPVQLWQVPPGEDWASELPSLKFGQTYEIACFGVGKAGNLPKELCTQGNPWELENLNNVTWEPQGRVGIQVRYLRRVPVGAPQILGVENNDPKAATVPFSPPKYPGDSVFPRALDLTQPPDGADQNRSPSPSRQLGQLVLLVPGDTQNSNVWKHDAMTSFSFAVRPPSTDITLWRRWVATDVFKGEALSRSMRSVVTEWYELAPQPLDGTDPTPKSESASWLDDPAVERLLFRLEEVAADKGLTPLPDQVCVCALGKSRTGCLGEAQSAAVRVTVNARERGTKVLVPKPQSVDVTERVNEIACGNGGTMAEIKSWCVSIDIPAGRVFRLTIGALVRKEYYWGAEKARFRCRCPADEVPDPVNGVIYCVASRTVLTLETATDDMPDSDHLWLAIKVLGEAGDSLVLGIDPATEPLFDHVKQVALDYQRWAWRGRRLEPLPFIGKFEGRKKYASIWALEPDRDDKAWDDLRKWDGAGFGDREDADHQRSSGTLPGPDRDSSNLLATGAALYKIELGGPEGRRAQYWRFRARAVSRYAGLMKDKDKGVARTKAWKRMLIKSRIGEPLPRPRVRFVLPLTQPTSKALPGYSAPLLVILDETWSRQAGPHERLQAEVVAAEIGYEPIDRKGQIPQQGKADGWFDVDMPFGLTFDTAGPVTNPSTTCFELKSARAEVVPGTLAKIRFRKRLDTSGDNDGKDWASDWTEPVWTQVLPDFSRWRVKRIGQVGGAHADEEVVRVDKDLRLSGDGRLMDMQSTKVKVLPSLPGQTDEDSPRRRRVYVLLTHLVVEAGATAGSEVPLSLGQFKTGRGEGTIGWQPPLPSTQGLKLRARLLETEYHVKHAGSSRDEVTESGGLGQHPLFKRLFPDVADEDVRERIVRISPPIDEGKPADAIP
jgi:hypothetical protein